MKCWLYRNMNLQDRERLIKFLLCTIFGITYSLLVRDPYSATAAVTANLFLYTDRGYYGGLRYAMKRIEVQIIQGALVLAVILPGRYWLDLPVPDTVLMILASCFAILIGLPLNYRHQISPYHTTLANATFILATGTIHNLSVYPYRVLHCVAGFLIGYAVNYWIMPQRDRYTEAMQKISACTVFMLDRLENKGSGGPLDYTGTKVLIETDIKFLRQDHEKGLPRHRRSAEEMMIVSSAYHILDYMEHIDGAGSGVAGAGAEQFQREWRWLLEENCQVHREMIGAMQRGQSILAPKLEESKWVCTSTNEIVVSSWLIQYRLLLQEIITTYNQIIEKAVPLNQR